LLKSEKQRIIWDEIENLHPRKDEHAVPGVPIKSFVPENDTIRMFFQSITFKKSLFYSFYLVAILRSLGFLVDVFPLHDKEDIKLIQHDWFMSKGALFKSQDIRKRFRRMINSTLSFLFR
jgi:hypothetical protein